MYISEESDEQSIESILLTGYEDRGRVRIIYISHLDVHENVRNRTASMIWRGEGRKQTLIKKNMVPFHEKLHSIWNEWDNKQVHVRFMYLLAMLYIKTDHKILMLP